MSAVRVQTTEQIAVWQEYRRAFHEFSERVRHLQSLTTDPHPDRAAIEAALVEVEKARVVYDERRDALAQHLLRSPRPHIVRTEDSSEAYAERVRDIAELLWESAGRPAGTADDDWHRAEEIVRRARTGTAA